MASESEVVSRHLADSRSRLREWNRQPPCERSPLRATNDCTLTPRCCFRGWRPSEGSRRAGKERQFRITTCAPAVAHRCCARCHVCLRVGSPRSVVPALPLSCGPKCTRSARDTPRRLSLACRWRRIHHGGKPNGNQGSSPLAALSPPASRPQCGLRPMATCADCAHAFDRSPNGRCALAASADAWRGVIPPTIAWLERPIILGQ
jgi:hypothetical protein